MIDVQDDIKGAVITIKIVGIGGGGNNVLRRLAASGFNKSQLLAINTDVRQLKTLDAEGIPCLLIGGALTKGRGTGGNVEKAQNAAISEKDEIAKAIAGADLVFLTAGMGKGVGTGAAPVVAKIAHDMNILTVGMVTLPFSHEGERKMNTAKDGVDLLRQNMDALVVVNNHNIEKLPEFRRITVGETFSTVDEVLRQSIGSIVEMIETTGFIILGTSVGRTALEAVQNAINSPLIELSIHGARGVIVNITGSEDLTLDSVREANDYILENIHPESNNICGLVVDEAMGDKVRATIIATDFDPQMLSDYRNGIKPISFGQPAAAKEIPSLYDEKKPANDNGLFGAGEKQVEAKQENNINTVDVPAFMQKKPKPLIFGKTDRD